MSRLYTVVSVNKMLTTKLNALLGHRVKALMVEAFGGDESLLIVAHDLCAAPEQPKPREVPTLEARYRRTLYAAIWAAHEFLDIPLELRDESTIETMVLS